MVRHIYAKHETNINVCVLTGRIPSVKYLRKLRFDGRFRFRKAQLKQRQRDVDPIEAVAQVHEFFDYFEDVIDVLGGDFRRLLVADETNLGETGIKEKVWGHDSVKRSFHIHSGFTGNITCLATADGLGESFPPFYVLKSKGSFQSTAEAQKWESMFDNNPDIAVCPSGTETSSMTSDIFLKYGEMLINAANASPEAPFYLLIDGCRVHSNPEHLDTLAEQGLEVIFLPSWLTSSMQVQSKCNDETLSCVRSYCII